MQLQYAFFAERNVGITAVDKLERGAVDLFTMSRIRLSVVIIPSMALELFTDCIFATDSIAENTSAKSERRSSAFAFIS